MATGDKLVTLDGLKAVYDVIDDDISDVKSNFDLTNNDENMFNPTTGNVQTWVINDSNVLAANNSGRVVIVECKPNTLYKVSKNAGGRFKVGDTFLTPVAGLTCTKVQTDQTASEQYYLTSNNANYLCAFVYYAVTDGSDYASMLQSVSIIEVTAVDSVARATTEIVDKGFSTYHYNENLSLLTNNGSGRYIVGHAFPAGYVDSVMLYVNANSTIEIFLYTLDNGQLNVAFELSKTSTETGMLEFQIKKNALKPFYIMVNGNGTKYRSNSRADCYGVSYADSYTLAELTVSHYEFGVDIRYGLFRTYQPLGKNYLLIGDSYLEGYTPDGDVLSWGDNLKNFMGINYNTVINYMGGVGFIAGNSGSADGVSFETLSLSADVPDSNTITHIVVCGGYNDAVRSLSGGSAAILTQIQTFVQNVSARYPNAKIYIGMIGYRNNDADVLSRIRGAVLEAYQTANRYGANDKVVYLNNVEWVLTSSDMASDGYHPNGDGQYKLGTAIKNALLTGSAPIRSFARDTD